MPASQSDAFPWLAYRCLGLTRRECEVLWWIGLSKRDHEIALILGLSSRTVEGHVLNILRKLDVENRTAAALRAHQFASSSPEEHSG